MRSLRATWRKKSSAKGLNCCVRRKANLRSKVSAVEVELTERERSATYIQQIQHVMDSFEASDGKITIWQKKDLLKAIFQRVVVTDEVITDCRLYYPFQKFYDELCAEVKRQQASQLQQTEEPCQSACILRPTDGLWVQYYRLLVAVVEYERK